MSIHTRELVELAALVATHGAVLISGPAQLSRSGLEDYWTASKCRLDRWGRELRKYAVESDELGDVWACDRWPEILPVLQEILSSEVLTRVWGAVVTAYDRRRGTDMAEPIVRSVLVAHLEARSRVLRLIHSGPCLGTEKAASLDRHRRRCERWTDLYIGYLVTADDVAEFAIDPNRAREFADDIRSEDGQGVGRQARSLAMESLRTSFPPDVTGASPNVDLNARIAASVIACFPAEIFESTGLFRSLWLTRIQHTTSDAQEMIDELLSLEDESAPLST